MMLSLAALFLRSITTLRVRDFAAMTIVGAAAYWWFRWIIRNHRIPPDTREAYDKD